MKETSLGSCPFASASRLCSGRALVQLHLSGSREGAQAALDPLLVHGSRLQSSGLCLPSQGRPLPPGLVNGRVSNRDSRNRLWAAAERGTSLGKRSASRGRAQELLEPASPLAGVPQADAAPARSQLARPGRRPGASAAGTKPGVPAPSRNGSRETCQARLSAGRRRCPLAGAGTASFFWTSPLPGVGVVLSSGQPLSSFRRRLPGWASYWGNPSGPSLLRIGLSTETAFVLLGFPNLPECNSVSWMG